MFVVGLVDSIVTLNVQNVLLGLSAAAERLLQTLWIYVSTLITLFTTQSEAFISENGTPSYPLLEMGVLVTLTHTYLSFIHIISLYLRE